MGACQECKSKPTPSKGVGYKVDMLPIKFYLLHSHLHLLAAILELVKRCRFWTHSTTTIF